MGPKLLGHVEKSGVCKIHKEI